MHPEKVTATRVIPIMVSMTEEDSTEAHRVFETDFLCFMCERSMMTDELEAGETNNFGDFIRWLFKLMPTEFEIREGLTYGRR